MEPEAERRRRRPAVYVWFFWQSLTLSRPCWELAILVVAGCSAGCSGFWFASFYEPSTPPQRSFDARRNCSTDLKLTRTTKPAQQLLHPLQKTKNPMQQGDTVQQLRKIEVGHLQLQGPSAASCPCRHSNSSITTPAAGPLWRHTSGADPWA